MLLVCVGMGGCISAWPPSVEVVGAELMDQGPEGARVEVALVLSNPNDFTLPLPETNYSVSLEGTDNFASVDLPARVLGPNDAQAIRLPAAFAVQGGRDLAGARWRVSGTVTYEPQNSVRRFLTESAVPLPAVIFLGGGELE
ncbi:MAG: hypothetical protein AAGG38_08840 [Planctomycetota bacterium]